MAVHWIKHEQAILETSCFGAHGINTYGNNSFSEQYIEF